MAVTVWERLREFASTQSGTFTSQEVVSWFRRHAPAQANERTVRTHVRGACWNVGDRSQFSTREPFLTRVDRGLFRRATEVEVAGWHGGVAPVPVGSSLAPKQNAAAGQTGAAETQFEAEWHTEANTQALLVQHLEAENWTVLSVANTATREHGIDVVATRDGVTLGVEVKGYPSVRYADPARAGEVKKTTPTTQAGHWYAQAVLAAMRLRSQHPDYVSVIALPAFARYRNLHAETKGSLHAALIEAWWVGEDGRVRHGD